MPEWYWDAEKPPAVFRALVETLPKDEQEQWWKRWEKAQRAQRALNDRGRAWDKSLTGVTRWGQ